MPGSFVFDLSQSTAGALKTGVNIAPVTSWQSVSVAMQSQAIARSEIIALTAMATGKPRETLLANPDAPLDDRTAETLTRLLERRAAGEPMAYLLGHREFYGRDFAVDSRVLIPRSETELLVDLAIAWIAWHATASDGERLCVLDLGTGSGVIAITLALECPSIEIIATDVSNAALEVSAQNARRLGAEVSLVASDWMVFFRYASERTSQFDLIVSNPPYIAASDPHLSQGDLRHEPRSALTDGADGLQAIRRIVADSASHLRPGGCLMLEHGYDQAGAVRELLIDSGFSQITSSRDLAGIERVTKGTRGSISDAQV